MARERIGGGLNRLIVSRWYFRPMDVEVLMSEDHEVRAVWEYLDLDILRPLF
ncbi:MAG: hypothetical protein ACUVT6_06425 [Thermodesulfobacteriota bacterium]